MTHLLLTGAGFSRNWGGWLADETLEYLLGAPEIDDYLRSLLWRSKLSGGGFEAALAGLQDAYTAVASPEIKERLNALTTALVGMFNAMNRAYSKQRFEPSPEHPLHIRRFLSLFDAIFTLNQDALLEFHYIGPRYSEKFDGSYMPYVERMDPNGTMWPRPMNHPMVPTGQFTRKAKFQPYYKLHGSANWFSERAGSRMLVIGGGKQASIKTHEILNKYHSDFAEYLSDSSARLMIIGYSFRDQHINDAIIRAAVNGLKLFIVDPVGVDVLDDRDRSAQIPQPVGQLMEKLMPRVIGASRRPLISTLNEDGVEQEKVLRFFE
jgi:hypothetical protein